MRAAVAEAKLQNLHARNIEFLTQFGDFVRDVAEVFGDERQLAQRIAQGMEQVFVRAL